MQQAPWMVVFLAICASSLLPTAASSAAEAMEPRGHPPSKAELRKKSSKELRKLLKEVGAKCHKCTEKDDYVERVLETWDWGPASVTSPDGSLTMDKATFMKQLVSSWRDAQNRENGGHEVEDFDPRGLPDMEKVWRDFSEKLARGEIAKDAAGQVVFDMNMVTNKEAWSQYRLIGMMALNLLLLVCMRRMKSAQKRRAELEQVLKDQGGGKGKAALEEEDSDAEPHVPGEELADLVGDKVGSGDHKGSKKTASGKAKGKQSQDMSGARKRHK